MSDCTPFNQVPRLSAGVGCEHFQGCECRENGIEMRSIVLDVREVFPTKIVCIGMNYVEHIRELGSETPENPVIFLKPNSAISRDIQSSKNELIHYESEISFVVNSGRLSAVGFGLDLTKRELQSGLKARGLPWERAKAFDGSAVFSEFVTFAGEISD